MAPSGRSADDRSRAEADVDQPCHRLKSSGWCRDRGLTSSRMARARPVISQLARLAAKRLLDQGRPLRCVWTGVRLGPGMLDIDHCLPWSAWPCGDLWNLLPATPRVNQHLKRDRLPSASALAAARESMISWWEEAWPAPMRPLRLLLREGGDGRAAGRHRGIECGGVRRGRVEEAAVAPGSAGSGMGRGPSRFANMTLEADPLLAPGRMFTREDVLAKLEPRADSSRRLAWYFDEAPPGIDAAGCHARQGRNSSVHRHLAQGAAHKRITSEPTDAPNASSLALEHVPLSRSRNGFRWQTLI